MPRSTDPRTVLRGFRGALYGCLAQRRDARGAFQEALLSGGPGLVPAYLSLEAVHRRGWGSLNAARARGGIDVEALRTLLARHSLVAEPVICAAAVRVWPSRAAAASAERGSG